MARRLKLAPAARQDLDLIWTFTAERWSPSQGDRYLRGLDEVFSLLCVQPGIGRLRRELATPVHAYAHKAHIILYRFSDNSLDVIRVVSARSNWQALTDI